MSPRLALQFLGLPQVSLNDKPIVTDRRKAIALLAYLAVNDIGHPHQRYSRESLSALFWPDYEQAKAFSNLRRTIWEVHQAIGEEWLLADRESMTLNPKAEIDLDVARFQDLLSQSRQQNDPAIRISLLIEATKLYRNHFLTAFSLKDAYPFNEWAFAESEELKHKFAEALTLLTESYWALNQAGSAIPYARRLISLDPLNETSHRRLMEVYIQAGQHSAALKQYQTCEQILRKELGLDPQPETLALYKKIRKGDIKPAQVIKPTETVTPQHNLPSQLSTFIGREKEQAEVMNLIAKNRLVTLVGTGGIGKTSLALQVGHKLLNEYPHGAWFTALDSLSDPNLVPQTVASVFDIRERFDRPVIEILMNMLREKTTLLILDNCEHLVPACTQLATTLLQKCPKLKILATSREVLNVTGEAIYQMPPLSVPEQNEASLEQLSDYESVRLFTDRASLALSSFALTNDNARAVIDICRKVDGIPLAIELAAARVNILQVAEILSQLQNSFTLLSTDNRLTLPRHQTLQASLDWSWGLLSEVEHRFMQQLAVFAGGWTLESAQATCDGDVLGLTSVLVKKSLIVVNQETRRETRYHFHEIVRQYAREKLIESGKEKDIRNRHLNYFLKLSEQAEPNLKGPLQVEWLARLNIEHDNLYAALDWARKTNVETGLFLAGRLHRFWESFGAREGERWLAEFVQKPEAIHYPLAKANALLTWGWLLCWFEKYELARIAAEECLALFRGKNDVKGQIDALTLLANTFSPKPDKEYLQRALSQAQAIGDAWRQARILSRLGWTYDDYQRRSSCWRQAIVLFRKAGDLGLLATYLGALGNLEMLNENIESAQERLDEAIELMSQVNIKAGKRNFLAALGRVESTRGNFEKARGFLEEGLMIANEFGIRKDYLTYRSHLGYLFLRQGKIEEARFTFSEVAREQYQHQDEIGFTFALEGIAALNAAIGKFELAALLIGWADATREKMSDVRPAFEQTDVDRIIAVCLAKMGEAAFSDAYEAGQKLTLDEAIAYALQED